MIICSCNAISDSQIEACVAKNKIKNILQLQEFIVIGDDCGTCIDATEQIINQILLDTDNYK